MKLKTLTLGICFITLTSTANAEYKIPKFVLGYLAGYAGHELGHQLMAWSVGENIGWELDSKGEPHWIPNKETDNLRTIAYGGFISEIIGTEIIMNTPQIPKDDAFVLGYLFRTMSNSLLYIIKDKTSSKGYGDYRDIRRNNRHNSWNNTDWIAAIKIAHTLWTVYRLHNHVKEQRFNFLFVPTNNSVMIGINYNF